MKQPIAVLISDIHYTVQNLELCSKALKLALYKASELDVDLIIAGDLNDSKAIIRGEVANELLKVLTTTDLSKYGWYHKVHLMPGNHDLLSVKDNQHSLNFLRPYVHLSDVPGWIYVHDQDMHIYLLPYQISNEAFLEAIKEAPEGSIVIAHQGFKGANLGSYFKDDTSVDPEAVKHLRIISGHYHMHQDIGTVTYIGSPFTQTFAEAYDGPKGFCVLYNDGSVELVPTNLRKHMIVERDMSNLYDPIKDYVPGDILQLKVTGPYNELDSLDKKALGIKLIGTEDFKLYKAYYDKPHKVYKNVENGPELLMDEIIDNMQEPDNIKEELKCMWRALG